ncbi:helix-turn-helix domain-containing protein [Marinicella rhabdoformis]|uniref:helix-turn-helix domain-containing protein n=1 Tax=Marinicella rhabdoformis TaxID=2580566 RepID=UPI0012AEBBA0|nr:RodZ domain-containing protein [Marinicella rhabdoformis]
MKTIEPNKITLSELAGYRSQAGFSAKQLADNMRVSLPIVEHIESGAFEKIGAAPFIRGHVVNYCKALKLDSDLVLGQIPGQLLTHKNVQRPDAFLPASVSKVRLRTNHYGRYAFGTTLLAVLSLSAYFVWDKWGVIPGQNDSLQLLSSDKESVTYSSIIPPVHKVGKGVVTEQATPVDLLESESEKTQGLTENVGSTVESLTAADQADDTEVDNAEAPEVQLAYVLEFDLQEAAWVSIKTEAGEKVVHDLIGPGLRRYESDQPMSLRIGNAEKLSLSINGESVDVVQFADKNLAKFSWPLDS